MRVRYFTFLIFVAVSAAAYFSFAQPGNSSAAAAVERTRARILNMQGDWVRVKSGDFEIACQEEGELRPVQVTSLNFLMPGKLGFMIAEGTYVVKGDRVIALDTKDLEDEYHTLQEDAAAREVELSQAEQTRDLEIKRLASELNTEKENAAFAVLKERETLAHPNDVEKEEAVNLLDGADAHVKSSEADVILQRPLFEQGFASKQDLELKEITLDKARIEMERAEMKARIIRDGPLPEDRATVKFDREYAALGLKLKEIDNEDQIDVLVVKVKSAERALITAKRKVEKRRLDLERSTLRAPHEGVVVYRQMGYRGNKKPEIGERVSPWIAPVDLPNYEKMKVRTQVPESLIRKIRARAPAPANGGEPERGSPARVAIKTIPGIIYTGQVTWIDGWARDRNAKLSDADVKALGLSGVKVFDVEVELDDSDPKHLREGFRATVDFPEETLKNAIAIPEQAVSTVDGVLTVMVMDGGSPVSRKIELGRASFGKVAIVAGLKDGEMIFVPRLSKSVQPDAKENDKNTPSKKNKSGEKKSSPPTALLPASTEAT